MGVLDFLQQAGQGTADFLATAGDRTAIGNVARAFGGRTDRNNFQQEFRRQFAEITPQLEAARTPEEFKALAPKITNALEMGIAAGYDPAKLAEHLAGYGRRNLGANEIQGIVQQLQPTPAQPRPDATEGPLTEGGNFIDPRAGRPFNTADAMKLAEVEARTGVKPPANLAALLQSPAEIASKETSTAQTQQKLEEERAKESAIQGLPTTEIPGTGVPVRTAARVGQLGGFITNTMPQRADPLDESRKGLIAAQTNAANAAAGAHGRANQPRDRTSAEYQDYLQLLPQGQQPTLEGFQDYVDRRRGGTSQTTTEQPVDPVRHLQVSAAIAKRAADSGKTDPASLASFANELGYDLEGSPTVNIPGIGSALANKFAPEGAVETSPRLKGEFNLKPKAKTVTKTRPGTAPGGQPAPQGGTVMMQAPDGSKRAVPADRVEEFKQKGAKVVGR